MSNLDSFFLKVAMMQGIRDTLADAVRMSFLGSDTGVKHATFLLIQDGDKRYGTSRTNLHTHLQWFPMAKTVRRSYKQDG